MICKKFREFQKIPRNNNYKEKNRSVNKTFKGINMKK